VFNEKDKLCDVLLPDDVVTLVQKRKPEWTAKHWAETGGAILSKDRQGVARSVDNQQPTHVWSAAGAAPNTGVHIWVLEIEYVKVRTGPLRATLALLTIDGLARRLALWPELRARHSQYGSGQGMDLFASNPHVGCKTLGHSPTGWGWEVGTYTYHHNDDDRETKALTFGTEDVPKVTRNGAKSGTFQLVVSYDSRVGAKVPTCRYRLVTRFAVTKAAARG